MDKAFIEKNQIVERYLTGKLPYKGAQEFERFCREHPEVLEELKLSERLHAGMRLLEASGMTGTFKVQRVPWWKRPEFTIALGVACALLVIAVWALASGFAGRGVKIATLEASVREGGLEAPSSTQTIKVIPWRVHTSKTSLSLGLRSPPELIELKIDVSFARFNTFRVSVERKGQARVGAIHNVLRDSNGEIRFLVNTSALHAGDYEVTIEGITRTGRVPVGWVNVHVAG
jgi:hypothetical protein